MTTRLRGRNINTKFQKTPLPSFSPQLKIKQNQLENQYETGRYGTPPADIGDLSRFLVSCLGPLVLLVPKF
jgi:hypothetical protein